MQVVIEVGQDNDGGRAAAVCKESGPQAEDREVLKAFYYSWPFPFVLVQSPPNVRAQRWAKNHGYSNLPVIEAQLVL